MSQSTTGYRSLESASGQTLGSALNFDASTVLNKVIERTSSFQGQTDLKAAESIPPDGGFKVLNDNHTSYFCRTSSIKCHPVVYGKDKQQRRLQRYSAAEESLAKLFRQCQAEVSPRELQIRVLEQATTMLSARAHDARERAEKLRQLLADRDTDPHVYETLKSQRWLEENRLSSVYKETKAIMQHLETLTSKRGDACTGDNSPDNVRRYQNLLRFLSSSPVRSPIRARKATSMLIERPPKRRTLGRSSPMRSRVAASMSVGSFHLRPISLENRTPRRLSHTLSTPSSDAPMQDISLSPTFSIVRRNTSTSSTDANECSETSLASSTTALTTATSPNLTLHPLPPNHTKTDVCGETGTATIYLNPFPTLPTSLKLDAQDSAISLPDYAFDLFSKLDCALPTTLTDIQYLHDTPLSDVGRVHQTSPLLKIPVEPQSRRQDREASPRKRNSFNRLSLLFSVPEALTSRVGIQKDALPTISAVSLALPGSAGDIREETKTKIKKRFSLLRLGRP